MTTPPFDAPSPGTPPLPNVPAQPQYQVPPQPGGYPAPAPYQAVPPQPYPPAGYAVPGGPVAPMAYKDSTAAWLLWFFTGMVGGHHFYLGNNQRGVIYAVTWGVSFLLSFLLIGFVGFLVLFVFWIIDATQLTQQLNGYNARAYATNQSLGLA